MEWKESHIKHRQDLFCMTVKACFIAKITKYKNLLRKHVHVDDDVELVTDPSEDQVELILGLSQTSIKPGFNLSKFGRQFSSAKVFQWILMMIQKLKARQILAHLYDIADTAIKATILEVAAEISVAFEYQLMVLYGDEEIVKLAQHTVSCFLTYLNNTDAEFTSAQLLQALLEEKPKCSKSKETVRTQPVLLNSEPFCLKWKLSHILKQPGLRIKTEGTSNNKSSVCQANMDDETETLRKKHVDISDVCDWHRISENLYNDEEAYDVIDGFVSESAVPLSSGNQGNDKNPSEPQLIELEHVSSIILGKHSFNGNNKPENSTIANERRISSLDMDFDEGILRISDHTVEINGDFSPISSVSCDDLDARSEMVDFERTTRHGGDEAENIVVVNKNVGLFKDGKEITSDSAISTQEGNKEVSINNISINTQERNNENYSSKTNTYHEDFGANTHNSCIKNICYDEVDNSIETLETLSFQDLGKVRFETDLTNKTHCNKGKKEQSCLNGGPLLELNGADDCYKFYGCFTPYGAKCQPSIYGFRGPLHVWDDNENKFRLIYNDRVTVNVTHSKEINNSSCIHQKYRPKTTCHH